MTPLLWITVGVAATLFGPPAMTWLLTLGEPPSRRARLDTLLAEALADLDAARVSDQDG